MRVDDPAADDAGEADVRQRGEGEAGAAHGRERGQGGVRAGAVVRPDRRDVERREPTGRLGGVDPACRLGLLVERQQRHDRERRHLAHRFDRRDEVVDVEERLDHEQVDAASFERARLLGVERAVLVAVEHLELAERPDRPGDHHVAAGDVTRLTGEADACGVDRLELVVEATGRELAAVGAEGVRLDQLRTGGDVARVHRDDALRREQVRLLRAAQAGGDAGEERTHAAIRDDRRPGGEPLSEVRHPPSLRWGEAEASPHVSHAQAVRPECRWEERAPGSGD